MAGIDFDRQVFAAPAETPKRNNASVIGAVVLFVAVALAGLVGYKLYADLTKSSSDSSSAAQVEELKQQLVDMQKRLDLVEKHRKPGPVETPAVVPPVAPQKNNAPPKIIYRVTSASKMPAVAAPPAVVSTAAPPNSVSNAAMESAVAANHEAWQATTNRLADVVGVVGTQQGEITETRDAVNQLLAQSRRKAVSFELQRGPSRTPIGPLSLQLKSVDTNRQRYSVCVYFQEKCIELKDRVLNEVVVFVVSKDSPPLEFVATKILRDQILGFVEVPVNSPER